MQAEVDTRAAQVAQQLLDSHDAPTLALNSSERLASQRLRVETAAFFAQPSLVKRRHSEPTAMFGFRELGREYSVTAERPDRNESFTLWGTSPTTVPEWERARALCEAILEWRGILAAHATSIFAEIATSLGGEHILEFERASYVQINDYAKTAADRDLLQDRHEDGHLLTMQCADAPGLEVISADGSPLPVDLTDEVVCMSGGLLTLMTGGLVAPRYHQVRNLGLSHRTSIMYFINPRVDRAVTPWRVTEANRGIDVGEVARSNPGQFGLPPVPEL